MLGELLHWALTLQLGVGELLYWAQHLSCQMCHFVSGVVWICWGLSWNIPTEPAVTVLDTRLVEEEGS